MSDVDTIEMYRSSGVNCVPIPKGSGKAMKFAWKKYQSSVCTLAIKKDQDFGVICGKSSGNLIVIDLDHTKTTDVFKEIFPTEGETLQNKTLITQTGNGFHIYLRVEGKLPQSSYLQKTLPDGKVQSLEIKSTGNYVVGASSDHYEMGENGKYYPSGKKYKIISTTDKIYTLKTGTSDIVEKLKEMGWHKHSETTSIDLGTKTQMEELRKGGWSGGSRHNNGFLIALHSYHVGKKNDEEVLAEALKINETCKPPKARSEVERWCAGAKVRFEQNLSEGKTPWANEIKEVEASKKDEEVEKVTNAVKQKYRFATYTDTEELMIWNGKYYDPIGAEFLVKEAVELEVNNSTQSLVNEVLAKIKRSTGKKREDFNKLGEIKDNKWIEDYNYTLENGILNVESLEFKPHTSSNYVTFSIPVTWEDNEIEDPVDFEAIDRILDGTTFWKYLKECFQENDNSPVNEQDVFTVLESMAYILHQNNDITKTIMFIGSGSNGKTKLLEYIQDLFGKKNTTGIAIQELADGGFVLAQLDGKLANICADVESTELRKSGKLKQLIGGEGIEVSRKYQTPYTMYSRAKFLFSANRFPVTYDQTDGFFRRFVILQWKRKFDGDSKDTDLGRKLRENEFEKSLVFNVLVRMARNLRIRGDFKYVKPVNEVREEWNNLSDPIMMFINNRIDDLGGHTETKRDVYADYVSFCHKHEMVPVRIGRFGKEFREYYEDTIEREGKVVGKVWCDLKIKPDPIVQGGMDEHLQ